MAVSVQEIMLPGCYECIRFTKLWEEKISKDFPEAKLETIDGTTSQGQKLIVKYGIFSAPGIVINGELFSTGRVKEKKLRQKLQELSGQ